MSSAAVVYGAAAVAAFLVAAIFLFLNAKHAQQYFRSAAIAAAFFALGCVFAASSVTPEHVVDRTLFAAAAYAWFLAVFSLAMHRPPARRSTMTATVVAALVFVAFAAGELMDWYAPLANAARELAAGGLCAAAAILVGRRTRGARHVSLTLMVATSTTLALTHVWFALEHFGVARVPPWFFVAAYACAGASFVLAAFEHAQEASALAVAQVELLAYHDPLTGLPNRSYFFDRTVLALSQAERFSHGVAILFFDLDRFKTINDSLGHHVGDALLRACAERVQRIVRLEDTFARFGGDEFTMVLPRIDSGDDAVTVANKLLRTFREPIHVGNRDLVVTTSVGIALYPEDGADPESLIRNADVAMYRAKRSGGDQYALYSPSLSESALARLELESRLRTALQNGELEMHYHPLIRLRDHSVFGVEALLRWRSSEFGYIPPQRFVAAAEVSGLIVEIGEWAMREACRQIARWQVELQMELTVCVNISPRQFRQPELVLQLQRALAEAQLPPSSLEIEITETCAMDDAERTLDILRALKSIGVRIAIDDFGTGYSSFAYLQKFPIDTLKLDRSFVSHSEKPQEAAIIKGLIEIAHGLGMKVIAEGVENENQLEFLKAQYCDIVQGYLFTEPLAPHDFASFVRQHRNLVTPPAKSWAIDKPANGQTIRAALVVDDDPAIRSLVQRILERARFQVDVAIDGAEALDRIRAKEYAAVFLDIMMPHVDGYEVIEKLKSEKPEVLKRVVVMTAVSPAAIERLSAEPVARVLPKPFDVNQIIGSANDVALERHAAES